MLSRFHLIPECYGRTDRQICYINIARHYADARQKVKNASSLDYNHVTNSAATLRMEIQHVAAYYFLRTINCRVDLRGL